MKFDLGYSAHLLSDVAGNNFFLSSRIRPTVEPLLDNVHKNMIIAVFL